MAGTLSELDPDDLRAAILSSEADKQRPGGNPEYPYTGIFDGVDEVRNLVTEALDDFARFQPGNRASKNFS